MEVSVLYCVNCGKELDDEMKFCTDCGSAVGGGFQQQGHNIPSMEERMHAKATIENHLVISILAILFFLPLGIAAIIQSMKVDQFIMMGEYELARNSSDSARKLALIGLGISAGIIILAIVFVMAVLFRDNK